MSKKPDFIIVGAPKCGTTALWRYLGNHPSIHMAPRKDLHFFGRDLNFRLRPRTSAEAYAQALAPPGHEQLVGEASVWYLYSREAAAEMHAYRPDLRIIAMIREPVDAMYSLYYQLRRNGLGHETLPSFEEALAAEAERKQGRMIPPHAQFPEALQYREVVRFGTQLERYYACFPPEQIHVIVYDDLRANPAAVYQAVLDFLQLENPGNMDFKRHNSHREVRYEGVRQFLRVMPTSLKNLIPTPVRRSLGLAIQRANTVASQRPPIDPALKARLRVTLRPEVERLEQRLGRDLTAWKEMERAE